ncbi:MAG: hypothetical protein A3I06_01170 [Candidatus Lindowbacteria bacterium RIFCSPLOWO2_02_FULL_62_12]|nr:MAG: hypothetical protein A3I06_01170 [Candidatus Lindowbacteria bacterium RIFCSPLOWO2_02_FULL_62_12]
MVESGRVRADDEGQLRRVEDKANRPKETSPEEAARQDAAERKELERQRRREEERERWRRAHPGERTPEGVGGDGSDWIWSDLAMIGLIAPFAGPYYLLDDRYDEPVGFEAYPFADDAEGCTRRDGRDWLMQTHLSIQSVSGNILATRADGSLNFWQRLALEGAYSRYEERLKNHTEILRLREALVTFMFAQNEFLDFRAGVGSQAIDGRNLNTGVKWVYRIRWFHRPFQFNLDLGVTTNLGASTLSEISPGVGWHVGRFESRLSYRRLKISGDRLAGLVLAQAYSRFDTCRVCQTRSSCFRRAPSGGRGGG